METPSSWWYWVAGKWTNAWRYAVPSHFLALQVKAWHWHIWHTYYFPWSGGWWLATVYLYCYSKWQAAKKSTSLCNGFSLGSVLWALLLQRLWDIVAESAWMSQQNGCNSWISSQPIRLECALHNAHSNILKTQTSDFSVKLEQQPPHSSSAVQPVIKF